MRNFEGVYNELFLIIRDFLLCIICFLISLYKKNNNILRNK